MRRSIGTILTVASICMLLGEGVHATETWHTSTIKYVYPLASGGFVLIFDTDAAACTNPNVGKYHYVTPNQNGLTEEGATKMYAAALLALATDKTVTIAFDDATVGCYVNRLMVGR